MTEPSPGEADPSDDRLRLELYELLHRRGEQERRWQFWRLAAGHLVVGTILAYGFLVGEYRFLALTPVLYGIVVMDALKVSVRRLYVQQRLVELEAELVDREPLYDWVASYGVFGAGQRVELWDVNLDGVPAVAQYVLIATIYLSLVAAALVTWQPVDAGSTVGPQVTRGLLLVGYATFSALFAGIVAVGYLHYARVRDRVTEVAAEMHAD